MMDNDKTFMARCIDLSRQSIEEGDNPFSCLIVYKNKIIVETKNKAILDKDITKHAEILAMQMLQNLLPSSELKKCTIYSNYEPCPMCSFMIREMKFNRVVFSLKSKDMGGYSRWNILNDNIISKFTPVFGKSPNITCGVLSNDAKKVFKDYGWIGMI